MERPAVGAVDEQTTAAPASGDGFQESFASTSGETTFFSGESEVEPEPPMVVQAQSTSNAITIQWSPVGAPVKGYYTLHREVGSTKPFHRQRILDLSTNVYEIGQLQPSTQYEVLKFFEKKQKILQFSFRKYQLKQHTLLFHFIFVMNKDIHSHISS